MFRTVFVAACLLIAACAPSEAEVGQTPNADTLAASANALQTVVTLRFRSDWRVEQSAALVKGGRARIEYDAARLNTIGCYGEQNGIPQYAVTAHYTLADAAEKLVVVSGLVPGGKVEEIDIDRDGLLTVWFEVTNRWGCHQWDSNFGNNFVFSALTPSVVTFGADWSVTPQTSLRGAKALAVDYALQRLPECRATYAGLPAWEILAYARFDNGAVSQAVTTRMDGSARLPAPATFAVPEGAHQVELWFFNSDRGGCSRYDSNWGNNYRLTLD